MDPYAADVHKHKTYHRVPYNKIIISKPSPRPGQWTEKPRIRVVNQWRTRRGEGAVVSENKSSDRKLSLIPFVSSASNIE